MTEKKANDYQVGGSHYQAAYQHWDWALRVPLQYLEAASTKYVARWRKKGQGSDDLKKALHYLNKLDEDSNPFPRNLTFDQLMVEAGSFAQTNGLGNTEHRYMELLSTWVDHGDLQIAREILFLLLDEAEALEKKTGADPKPVPLTEENHYAPRSGADPIGW